MRYAAIVLGALALGAVHTAGAATPDTKPIPFVPPPAAAMPGGPLGDAIRLGENVFRHTTVYAKGVIGNAQNCSNCHLDAGRLAGAAPLWAAYTVYPAYRSKNKKINDYVMRVQDCFWFSENGKVPAADSAIILGIEAYSYWLATGAPTGAELQGRGYPELAAPATPPAYAAGEAVYKANCALCHGADGSGQYVRGQTVFPPLWGAKSFNWGAGMGSVQNAAEFIHANPSYSPHGRDSLTGMVQPSGIA